ncbi:NAD-dependent succinate-semialdehyde dehydrogenase [Actinomadura sp. KC216]|uniref:NAD-dependent succinate-semialdehyde dehydrogenase n=1 Tax=Actinomadura sp. KC216 TaxID=2530370 RepID=UPI0010438D75|nr:NAD-dependent succinate-semialdehyde dehydrogenase [Actinomadura sp. KC216]TDB87915.1 NAD-dependent succinate-semialdehyde dehydrogenase [Actinomadura sp. KC216]
MTAAATAAATAPTDLLVDGTWRAASGGRRFAVHDPSTGEPIAEVSDATADDARAAVSAAHRAGPAWAARPPRERAETLRRVYELMTGEASRLARLIVAESGKALADARAEVSYAAEFFRWYAEEAVRGAGEMSRAPGGERRILVLHRPVGVCLLITPWNFPAAMATRKIAPALAAGCPVVLKPAALTPLTALAIAELTERAGVPPGVVNVLPTRDPSGVVGPMLADPRVRKLSFTGGTATGRTLLEQAAGQILNCSMELGGNAPFLVFADADLDAAIDGALAAKMRNGGQACTAANRFYVQRPVYDEFVTRFAEAMSRLRVGPGLDEKTDVGPLVNAAARDKVAALVQEALDGGARALVGGHPLEGPGYFYPPTVLTGVPADARVLHEEIFGPVAPVLPFDTEDEAVAAANHTEYGLIAYLYTSDLHRGLRLTQRLETGMIGLNQGVISDPAAPFGGVKQSGLGREGGHHGLLDYLEPVYVGIADPL